MNTRIGIRIAPETRSKIEAEIQAGRFKDISHFIRQAIEEFLSRRGV